MLRKSLLRLMSRSRILLVLLVHEDWWQASFRLSYLLATEVMKRSVSQANGRMTVTVSILHERVILCFVVFLDLDLLGLRIDYLETLSVFLVLQMLTIRDGVV